MKKTVIKIILIIGCSTRYTKRKNKAEARKVTSTVEYRFCLNNLYTATERNTVKDIAKVATVNIAAEVFGA